MRRLLYLIFLPLTLLRGCLLAVVLLILLIILASCLALGWGLGRVSADTLTAPDATPSATVATTATPTPLDVCLVIDQSDSLWTMGGVGSDPQQLRMAAARVFAARLAAEPQWQARLGLVYFGAEAKLALPLSPLDQAETQQRMDSLTATRMGWTEIVGAVEAAERELLASERADLTHRKVLVIFTDGRPDTPQLGPPDSLAPYLGSLEERITRLTQRGVLVFTVLLNNSATATDPLLQRVYRPFWVQLAERGGSVRFYDVASPEDLVQTYADIAMLLGAGTSRGLVVNETVAAQGRAAVQVGPGWRRLAFLVTRSRPEMQVTINRPGGHALVDGEPGIGHRASTRDGFDVWTVEAPAPGEWTVETRGDGVVTVRLDYEALPPTATPTPTATATITPMPTGTPTATLTPTPSPTEMSVAMAPVAPPTPSTLEASPPDDQGPRRWWWAALLALPLALAGVVYARRRPAGRSAPLQGLLRQTSPSPDGTTAQVWDLTPLRRRTLVVGAMPGADIRLPGDSAAGGGLLLERRPRSGGGSETWLVVQSTGSAVRVNGTPVAKERRLSGWDTIALGAWQGRYENLPERAASERAVRAGDRGAR